MTPETLDLFRRLLDNLTLQANAPDFEELAAAIVTARRELVAERTE